MARDNLIKTIVKGEKTRRKKQEIESNKHIV